MMKTPQIFYSTGSDELFVLIHGQQSSKREWLDPVGYTKGGQLTNGLMDRGISFLAFDLYGHGDYKSVDYDKEYLDDDEYEDFINTSVKTIGEEIVEIKKGNGYRRISLVTYSTGSVIGLRVQELYNVFDHVYLCAPVPQKEYDDEYSLHNNLSHVNQRVVIFCGKQDDEVPLAETTWFYETVSTEDKKIFTYESGHSLPEEWVSDFLSLLAF